MDLDQQGIRLRVSRTQNYLDIANQVAQRATCLRRKFGAVIVNGDTIISTGYNGAVRGGEDCLEKGKCLRQVLNIPSGEKYEMCVSVHAEQNAIINSSIDRMRGAYIYISGIESDTGEAAEAYPCVICRRMIVNAGIHRVFIRTPGGIKCADVNNLYIKCMYDNEKFTKIWDDIKL